MAKEIPPDSCPHKFPHIAQSFRVLVPKWSFDLVAPRRYPQPRPYLFLQPKSQLCPSAAPKVHQNTGVHWCYLRTPGWVNPLELQCFRPPTNDQPRALGSPHMPQPFIHHLGNSRWATAGRQGIPSLEKLPPSCGLLRFPLKASVSTSVFLCYCKHFLVSSYCAHLPGGLQCLPEPSGAPSPAFPSFLPLLGVCQTTDSIHSANTYASRTEDVPGSVAGTGSRAANTTDRRQLLLSRPCLPVKETGNEQDQTCQ